MEKTLKPFREDRGIASIPEILFRSVREFAFRPVFSIFRNGTYQHITYAELGKQVELLASGLRALGFSRREKAAILGPNSPEWAMSYLAVLSAGGICVPIDFLLKRYEESHSLFCTTNT